MHVDDDHLYHGAALIQVAEHPQFTAINPLKVQGRIVPVAYKINDEIALYLKYSSKPTKPYGEYPFTFGQGHLECLKTIDKTRLDTFVALICVEDREVCCLSYNELIGLIHGRRKAFGRSEGQYVVLATAERGKRLRV